MTRSQEFAGSVREQLDSIAQSLRDAANEVVAISRNCDGTVNGLERATAGIDALVTTCAELMARSTNAIELAMECSAHDRRSALPRIEPRPEDSAERARILERLEQTPLWSESQELPLDVEALIARLEADQRWLAERRWSEDDVGHALGHFLPIRSALRQIEAVAQAGEAFAQHKPDSILHALALSARRLRVRVTRER
jgi:hypothetical protein